jgi:ABC-type nitrate/sulfonate/bicarbonate transport system permease component
MATTSAQSSRASAPRAAAVSNRRWPLLSYLSRFTTLVVVVVMWQLGSAVWLPSIDPYLATLMPPPLQIVRTAAGMVTSGELGYHVLASLKREGIAFLLSLLAVPVGVAMGWFERVHKQLDPLVEILRPIPPLAWIPLSILWFGIGDEQNEFIIFLGMFFPILINTIQGVRTVDSTLVRAARSLGANEGRVLTRVVLKAALPQIVTGMRVGLGFGWMALVAAELVGANSGLGFLINDARSVLRTDIIIVGMLTIGLMGLIIDATLRLAMGRLMPWAGPGGR